MKPGLKKLRSCAFSKERVAAGYFSPQEQYNHRLVCDHPKMRENWSEKVCVDCRSYVNRNKPPEPQPKAQTPKKKRAPRTKKS